jgi:hypothetical protein
MHKALAAMVAVAVTGCDDLSKYTADDSTTLPDGTSDTSGDLWPDGVPDAWPDGTPDAWPDGMPDTLADTGWEGTDTTGLDRDGDGWTPAEGDCNDDAPAVNPGAWDAPDNGVDDDCDTVLDAPMRDCDCGPMPTHAEGLDACDPAYLRGFEIISHAANAADGRRVRSDYGSPSNALSPHAGCAYSLLGTGAIEPPEATCGERQPGTDLGNDGPFGGCTTTEPEPNPGGGDGALICDTQQLVLELQAPTNAMGFSFDFVFLSSEYPEWVGEGFNDTFYALLQPAGGDVQNIAFDAGGGEIEVDSALFEDPPVTDVGGTGYTEMAAGEICGSSTGWLRTSWPISPGEVFSLTFSIHDEGDGIYDSVVILDNFRWSLTPVVGGTEPI